MVIFSSSYFFVALLILPIICYNEIRFYLKYHNSHSNQSSRLETT